MDSELAAALPAIPDLDISDIPAARRQFSGLVSGLPKSGRADVGIWETRILGEGSSVRLRFNEPRDSSSLRPLVLHFHGGGFVMGSPEMDDAMNAKIARATGALVVSPEYRLAPEHPFPAAFVDASSSLSWLLANAGELRIATDSVAVMGFSAGGNLAAAVAQKFRDDGNTAIATQLLLEPVLDDRLVTTSMLSGGHAPVWSSNKARLSWSAYLGDSLADSYAAPTRAADLSGLPPAYITVNELDPLRDEGLEYAIRLMHAGVETEVHVWPGAYHGFTLVRSAITRRAKAALIAYLKRMFLHELHEPGEPSPVV